MSSPDAGSLHSGAREASFLDSGGGLEMKSSETKILAGIGVRNETSENPTKEAVMPVQITSVSANDVCQALFAAPLAIPVNLCHLSNCLVEPLFLFFFSPSSGAEMLGSKPFCRMVSPGDAKAVFETWKMLQDWNRSNVDASVVFL